jgi:hypothetical protein
MHEMLKTSFGDNAMGRKQIFDWFSQFKNGETSVKTGSVQECPSTGRAE